MYDVQVFAADGTTLWYPVQANSESTASAKAVARATAEHPSNGRFVAGPVMPR